MKEFSAQHFAEMSSAQFEAEAKRLGVNLDNKSRRQQIDAVYNAELRRRSVQPEEVMVDDQSAAADVSPEDTPIDYADMTVMQLRELAAERDVDLTGITLKADIIKALEEADQQHVDNDPKREADKLDEATE